MKDFIYEYLDQRLVDLTNAPLIDVLAVKAAARDLNNWDLYGLAPLTWALSHLRSDRSVEGHD